MLAMFGLGTGEILLIVLVILLLFGATRVPQLMGSLGKGIKEFKKGLSSEDDSRANKEAPQSDTQPSQQVPVKPEVLKSGLGKNVRLLPDGTLEIGGVEGAVMVEVDQNTLIARENSTVTKIPLAAVKRVVFLS